MDDCIFSFFDLYFDSEGKVYEKEPESADCVHIVTESGELRLLRVKVEDKTREIPLKYEKNVLLRAYHVLSRRADLKAEVINLIKEHIVEKNESFYVLGSFAVFLSLCSMLSAEFSSPLFSEELLVKVNFSESRWRKIFTRFWNVWNQVIFESIEESTKVYEESKEEDSKVVFENELEDVLSEGGVDVPLVIEMVKNISQKKASSSPKIVEVTSEEEKPKPQPAIEQVVQQRSETKEEPQPESKHPASELQRFKDEVLGKISRLERQVLSISEIVKKLAERISK